MINIAGLIQTFVSIYEFHWAIQPIKLNQHYKCSVKRGLDSRKAILKALCDFIGETRLMEEQTASCYTSLSIYIHVHKLFLNCAESET